MTYSKDSGIETTHFDLCNPTLFNRPPRAISRRKVYLGKKIADGGFSVVFKARDYHSDDKKPCFALKRIVCGDNEMVEKCREEARVHQA